MKERSTASVASQVRTCGRLRLRFICPIACPSAPLCRRCALHMGLQWVLSTELGFTRCNTHPCRPLHRRGHLFIASQCLHPERDRLQLYPHLREFLDIPSCSDEILGEDLTSVLDVSLMADKGCSSVGCETWRPTWCPYRYL